MQETDWASLVRLEADILTGKQEDIESIENFSSQLCFLCMAYKLGMPWKLKKQNLDSDVPVGGFGPWPILKRVQRVLDKSTNLWQDQIRLSFYKAFVPYLEYKYDQSETILRTTVSKVQKIPIWYFSFLKDVLFKAGKYHAIITSAQKELKLRKDVLPPYQPSESSNSLNVRVYKLSRSNDFLPDFDQNFETEDHLYPVRVLLETLSDLGQLAVAKSLIRNKKLKQTELLDMAIQAHSFYLLPQASQFYEAYLEFNRDDSEIWFILGRVNLLLNLYQAAVRCMKYAGKEKSYSGWTHYSIGEIAFKLDKFEVAESEFQEVISFSTDDLTPHFAKFYLGFIKEIQGNYHNAAAWYEAELNGPLPNIAENLLHILNLRQING